MRNSSFILLCALMSGGPAWADGQSGSNVNGGVNAVCLIELADSAAALALGCPPLDDENPGNGASGSAQNDPRAPGSVNVVVREGALLNDGSPTDGTPPPEVTVTRADGTVVTPRH